jgi:hypothetical protein
MSTNKILAGALLAATFLSSAAFALDQTSKQDAADHDFTKLSAEGLKAFQDVRLARVAIFDGNTQEATTDLNNAKAAIAKAKTDDTVFMKAEADLKPPAGMTNPPADKASSGATKTAWIPINGALTLDEDYTESPTKAAGVAKANEQLKKGDAKEAVNQLKLAEIDAVFVTEVAPLDKSTSGIDQAAQLIDSGKYFQANQALKAVEDGVRYDAVDVTGVPQKTASQTTESGSGTSSSTSAKANASSAAPAGK